VPLNAGLNGGGHASVPPSATSFNLGEAAAAKTPSTHLGQALAMLKMGSEKSLVPLNYALSFTCPECTHDSEGAYKYPITLVSSFIWVAFFSTCIAAVVTRWGEILGIPAASLGLYVIAVGAEIPDTIQSVTVAKRGYGSMAVSNSTGSQIINILIGLGFPWALTNMAGQQVSVSLIGSLNVMANMQLTNVCLYMSILLLPTIQTWKPGDHSKASLGWQKGFFLMCLYMSALCLFPVFSSWVQDPTCTVAPPPPPSPRVRVGR